MPAPPPTTPTPQRNHPFQVDQETDLLDALDTAGDLMDAWLEATKHMSIDGNVVLAPVVVKLVTALLHKVTTALKDL
ncbi:hypothetical protein CROQUDRAFT_99284 [Cronartium quercuum f. sp. fusiforme G11]|uniref:Uncharacterized protein n=1 Tax=Cronartium quercuum f. sp. fusiforme G11 TaxID=708437 RepID=A0A9P6NC16_9BASI|nr:hypothetical protein CROQUDRAFT_99284 [Cronartium quercuum f. sp. fusiforme G11]